MKVYDAIIITILDFCDFIIEQNQDNRLACIRFKQKSSVVSKLVNNLYIVHYFPECERLCNIMLIIFYELIISFYYK